MEFPDDPKQHDIDEGLARLGDRLTRAHEPGAEQERAAAVADRIVDYFTEEGLPTFTILVLCQALDVQWKDIEAAVEVEPRLGYADASTQSHPIIQFFPLGDPSKADHLAPGDVIAPGAFGTEPVTVPLTDRPGGEVIGEATVHPDGSIDASVDRPSWEELSAEVRRRGLDRLPPGQPVPPWHVVLVDGEWRDDEWVGPAGLVDEATIRPMSMFERVGLVLDRHAQAYHQWVRKGLDYDSTVDGALQTVDDVFAAIGHDPRGADSTCYALPKLYDRELEEVDDDLPWAPPGYALDDAARLLVRAVAAGQADVRTGGSDGGGRTVWRITGTGPNLVHFGQAHVREALEQKWLVVGNGGVLQVSSLVGAWAREDDGAGS